MKLSIVNISTVAQYASFFLHKMLYDTQHTIPVLEVSFDFNILYRKSLHSQNSPDNSISSLYIIYGETSPL